MFYCRGRACSPPLRRAAEARISRGCAVLYVSCVSAGRPFFFPVSTCPPAPAPPPTIAPIAAPLPPPSSAPNIAPTAAPPPTYLAVRLFAPKPDPPLLTVLLPPASRL